MRHISPQGLRFIQRYQGIALEPYFDEYGLRVIGYGHVIRDDEAFCASITAEEAAALLTLDVQHCLQIVRDVLQADLSQAQFDALLSLAYSCGPRTPPFVRVLTLINAGRMEQALTQWRNQTPINGRYSANLTRQRMAECGLFRDGIY